MIAFLNRDKTTGVRQLWRMNATGADQQQLTRNKDYDIASPKWSPNGKYIAFASTQGVDSHPKHKVQNWDIWIMDAGTGKQFQLTTNGSCDDEPCWDRTGEFIYFRSNRGNAWRIWRLQPDFKKIEASK